MFRCEVLGKMSKLGEKCNKIVVETRERIYTKWFFNEDLNDWEEVVVGRGHEIVHEISATKEGLAKWNELQAANHST